MSIGQAVGIWLAGLVGAFLFMTAMQFPDLFTWLALGAWTVASALFGLAVWRGDRRP